MINDKMISVLKQNLLSMLKNRKIDTSNLIENKII